MSKVYEMIRQSLMDGLKRANYDVTRLQPAPVKTGFFSDYVEVQAAEGSARAFVTGINFRIQNGESFTPDLLEKEVDMKAAESAFFHATMAIRIYLASGKNVSKYVQDARAALEIMKKHQHSGARIHEASFKELIGEE